MGTIQQKSIQSTIMILAGFAIGAFNLLVLVPRILTTEQFGLTRLITDAALTLATMCTLGCLPVINKFYPFYKDRLAPAQRDLPFITGLICLVGMIAMFFLGWLLKDVIVRKFSEKSPLFVSYSYLVYPYCFFMLAFLWLESFAIAFRKSLLSNSLKELAPRVFFTIILVIFSFGWINDGQFYQLFSLTMVSSAIILFVVLRRTGEFRLVPSISPVTNRMKGTMISFGLFIFGSQFLNLLSRTVDTFILSAKSDRGLTDAAVFTIATYVVTIMEVPQRSMNTVTIPVLAEAWKNRDIQKIRSIYQKSVNNLLVVGLVMAGLIWINLHNLAGFLGKNFSGIEMVVFYMGIGKLIDLGTGANSQIIGTSSYWKVDFLTNVFYTLLALPLNYFLITHFGLLGAAYSTLISLVFYNMLRFGFLWWKFGMQPYTGKTVIAILIGLVSILVTMFVPVIPNYIPDTIVRSLCFCIFFVPAIYLAKISPEINTSIDNYLLKIKSRFSR